MKRQLCLSFLMLALASCASPPAQPGSLWDSLPQSEGEAAKEVPSKIWQSPSPETGGSDESAVAPEPVDVAGAVVLNEVFYDSAESDTDGHLFVELHGAPGLAIGGCKVVFINGSDGGAYDTIAIPAGAALRDDGFYLIADAKTGSSTESNVSGADLIDTFDPQNGPDAVQLLDSRGNLVDAVGYGEGILSPAQNGLISFEGAPAPDVASGHSLERREAGADTDDNAADFEDRESPTPGYSPEPDLVPEPVPEPPVSQDPPAEPGPSTPPVVEPPVAAQKVVINEIFYDAVGSDSNGVLFIELFGDADTAVGNYRIHFVDGADGSVDDTIVLPPDSRLRHDGYYLVADSKNGLPTETALTGADFIDNFDPANGPDAVQLLDDAGNLRDAAGYGVGIVPSAQDGLADFEQSPTWDVVEGHSLERRSPGWDTDDNASDFVDNDHPTPGY